MCHRPSSTIPMRAPLQRSEISLEEVLRGRRSRRRFRKEKISFEALSQLLWAAQGVTPGGGYRTAPSAGALYPLELYVAAPGGLLHYLPAVHACEKVLESDVRGLLYGHALAQEPLAEAPCVFVLSAAFHRLHPKYGDRAECYTYLEAGHAAQNLLLQAVALGLGAVPIGAFDRDAVHAGLHLSAEETPVYLIPVGRPR